jgi:hypothetical protein
LVPGIGELDLIGNANHTRNANPWVEISTANGSGGVVSLLQDADAETDDQTCSLRQAKFYFPEVVNRPKVNHEIRYTVDGGNSNVKFL